MQTKCRNVDAKNLRSAEIFSLAKYGLHWSKSGLFQGLRVWFLNTD